MAIRSTRDRHGWFIQIRWLRGRSSQVGHLLLLPWLDGLGGISYLGPTRQPLHARDQRGTHANSLLPAPFFITRPLSKLLNGS
jgi:hypothetical protein